MGQIKELDSTVRKGAQLLRTMEQDQWWWPQGSEGKVRLEDMTASHRLNLMRWMKRHAKAIAQTCSWGTLSFPMPNVDTEAYWGLSAALDEEWDLMFSEPWKWVREQKLTKRLQQLVNEDFARGGPPTLMRLLEPDF